MVWRVASAVVSRRRGGGVAAAWRRRGGGVAVRQRRQGHAKPEQEKGFLHFIRPKHGRETWGCFKFREYNLAPGLS